MFSGALGFPVAWTIESHPCCYCSSVHIDFRLPFSLAKLALQFNRLASYLFRSDGAVPATPQYRCSSYLAVCSLLTSPCQCVCLQPDFSPF